MTLINRINALASRPTDAILAGHTEYAEILALKGSVQASDIDLSLHGADLYHVNADSALESMDFRESWDEIKALRAKYRDSIDGLIAPWYRNRRLYELMREHGTLR